MASSLPCCQVAARCFRPTGEWFEPCICLLQVSFNSTSLPTETSVMIPPNLLKKSRMEEWVWWVRSHYNHDILKENNKERVIVTASILRFTYLQNLIIKNQISSSPRRIRQADVLILQGKYIDVTSHFSRYFHLTKKSNLETGWKYKLTP